VIFTVFIIREKYDSCVENCGMEERLIEKIQRIMRIMTENGEK